MPRKPSAETELRYLRAEKRQLEGTIKRLHDEANAWRGRASRAEAEAAEWRKRFDMLLARCKLEAVP